MRKEYGKNAKEMRVSSNPEKIMYHCTRRRYVFSILKKGLSPKKPKGIEDAVEGVYLSERPFDWMDWVTNQCKEPCVMIKINVEGLDLVKDEGIDKNDIENHPAAIYKGMISPERFVEITVSTVKRPTTFIPLAEWRGDK